MVLKNVHDLLKHYFKASEVKELETIQSLWSGYGTISRWQIVSSDVKTVIVKHIHVPEKSNHPRGWNTQISHLRKVKSYEVEIEWYGKFELLTNSNCRIPKCYFTKTTKIDQFIVLEDLDVSGFTVRRSELDLKEVKICLLWLANFHGKFMNVEPDNLWTEGAYWHLETRPEELSTMESGWLKTNADKLDDKLIKCKHRTIIHGDAKVANFCFTQDMKTVAAVDFQYVGGGCGMKDVIYLLSSCLTEFECELHEDELLDHYFEELKLATSIERFNELEKEWRGLYCIAWADFTRFLLGWMPTHQKLNSFSLNMVEKAKEQLASK